MIIKIEGKIKTFAAWKKMVHENADKVKKYGITKHHRKKFKPVHKILINKTRETQ